MSELTSQHFDMAFELAPFSMLGIDGIQAMSEASILTLVFSPL